MARSMKIKVRTADLLARVEAARAAAVKDHEKAVAKHEAAAAAWASKVEDALYAAVIRAQEGKLPDTNYQGHLSVPIKGSRPCKPSLSTARFDRDIAILKMASEDTLSIGTDDDERIIRTQGGTPPHARPPVPRRARRLRRLACDDWNSGSHRH